MHFLSICDHCVVLTHILDNLDLLIGTKLVNWHNFCMVTYDQFWWQCISLWMTLTYPVYFWMTLTFFYRPDPYPSVALTYVFFSAYSNSLSRHEPEYYYINNLAIVYVSMTFVWDSCFQIFKFQFSGFHISAERLCRKMTDNNLQHWIFISAVKNSFNIIITYIWFNLLF